MNEGDMGNKQMFSTDNYFGKYELIVREEIGKELDDLKYRISQIQAGCTKRIMNINFKRDNKGSAITVDDLRRCESDLRDKALAALLYNDALWRLEAAHLMMCIGLLNVAYANMRMSLEALLSAYIVERNDEEAQRFLRNEKVNLKLAEELIRPQQNDAIIAMKNAYSVWGVHSYFEALQLSSLFGASRFDKFVVESNIIQKTLQLPKGFIDAEKSCIEQCVRVVILFDWLESITVKT